MSNVKGEGGGLMQDEGGPILSNSLFRVSHREKNIGGCFPWAPPLRWWPPPFSNTSATGTATIAGSGCGSTSDVISGGNTTLADDNNALVKWRHSGEVGTLWQVFFLIIFYFFN